jgi:uncharacterized protein YgiM (DUF1202 family)
VIAIICLALVISGFPGIAEAAQLGRITGEVNFREGPSRSTARIGRLATGTEVEVIKRESNGWYSIVHEGRKGFVHPNYVIVETGSKARKRFGLIVMILGATLVALYFVPILPRLALILIVSVLAIILLDFGFSLGVLYSLTFVSLALLGILLFLKSKEKSITTPIDSASEVTRKAA